MRPFQIPRDLLCRSLAAPAYRNLIALGSQLVVPFQLLLFHPAALEPLQLNEQPVVSAPGHRQHNVRHAALHALGLKPPGVQPDAGRSRAEGI